MANALETSRLKIRRSHLLTRERTEWLKNLRKSREINVVMINSQLICANRRGKFEFCC